MTKQEILDRIQNVLNQGVDTRSNDLDLLRHDLENDIIESKIDLKVSAEHQIGRRAEDKIKEQLVSKGYPLINESYDYLLKLPIYSLTKEEIDKLLQEKGDLESQHSELSNKTTQDIWLSELSTFEKEYSKFLKK